MEKDDKIIHHVKIKESNANEELKFFQNMDEYDKTNLTTEPNVSDNYVTYGYRLHKKEKKIDFLVTTSKLKEVFWYLTNDLNVHIFNNIEYFIFERRNQFIIEIYNDNILICEACVRKLTREGRHLLNNLKGDTKITASPYSQNLKFINFLMDKSV